MTTPTSTPPAAQPEPLAPTPVTDALAMELGQTPSGYVRTNIPDSSFWTAIELAREFEAKHAVVADELETLRLLYRSAVSAAMGNAEPLPAPDPSRAALVAALRAAEGALGKAIGDMEALRAHYHEYQDFMAEEMAIEKRITQSRAALAAARQALSLADAAGKETVK